MFYHIISDANTKLLGIDNIGFSSDPDNNKFGPGQRNMYLIHYIISGNGFFNGSYLGKGQGFLIKPNTYEHYYPDPQNPWTFLWITSHDLTMEEIFKKYNANNETSVFDYTYIGTIKETSDFLLKNHNKICSPTEILEIFLHILNNQDKICNKEESLTDTYYNYAINYIQANLYRRLRVEELTEFLGITQPHLYNIFKEKCRMSPKCYIDNCKINEAKKLLTETNLSITQIANSVGFHNVSDFSKFFKNKIGLSPKTYLATNFKCS